MEALSTHLVSTDFDPATGRVVVNWPRPSAEHARAAAVLADLARELRAGGHAVATIDLGGGFPPAPAVASHAHAVAAALRDGDFAGALLVEPGRAVVADAVDFAFTVVAVKTLADGSRCLDLRCRHQLPPRRTDGAAADRGARRPGPLSPAVVTGPLCLNIDVIHPRVQLPLVAPGDRLVARSVGAYQQVAVTQFGERPPPVTIRELAAQPVSV